MANPFIELLRRFQKGNVPAIHLGPFLPLARIKERNLAFNDIMQDSRAMTQAALMSFEFGFESTVLPFDLNVEAEILGARVRYHAGFDGNPVYPTIAEKPFTLHGDILLPESPAEIGRLPAILESIRALKPQARDKGALGVFLPGPFTLAGQVLDMDALYVMLLKQPDQARIIFQQLTVFIDQLIDIYVAAGVDFITVVEGGGASISPKIFRKLVLPCLMDIFQTRKIPRVMSLFGSSPEVIDFMLACDPDAIALAKECRIENVRGLIPDTIPLFGECGNYDMLAHATPAEITAEVDRCLDLGFTSVGPPADIYPPAKIANIEAFVTALREYVA